MNGNGWELIIKQIGKHMSLDLTAILGRRNNRDVSYVQEVISLAQRYIEIIIC